LVLIVIDEVSFLLGNQQSPLLLGCRRLGRFRLLCTSLMYAVYCPLPTNVSLFQSTAEGNLQSNKSLLDRMQTSTSYSRVAWSFDWIFLGQYKGAEKNWNFRHERLYRVAYS